MSVIDPTALRFGPWRLRLVSRVGLGLVVDGLDGESPPANYVDEVLLSPDHREVVFSLVDSVGLLVCTHVGGEGVGHRDVRGRSSRGRLSQGEYFHHDGCSGPAKPRVVEIRCPYQEFERSTCTAIAPFPEVVHAMVLELPANLRTGELATIHHMLLEGGAPSVDWNLVQGTINRALRRGLDAEAQRAYFRQVDARVGAYCEPWQMGESRFIANANPVRTMQHRRAYLEVHTGKRPNGRLVKRWPAESGMRFDEEACEL